MVRLTGCLMLLAALMILVIGCSDEPDPMMSGSSDMHRGLAAALSIPPGSTLEVSRQEALLNWPLCTFT